ncbi:hypothetical protein N7467_011277 [Penicillium canescens]|nr:hypothetical protein N7467_011277 [Penicillium canescens]
MAKPDNNPDQLPMAKRLTIAKYDAEDCKDAIHGSRIPKTMGEQVHRLCTIRGIRHHYGFAQELRGVTPEFTRALNARDIMSGIIPTISQPEETPYCIWYPEVPKEDTLRALVQRYPDMLYHAARACAVAGYFDLYQELDPLPEVHVAEEAGYASMQKSSNGSQQIYEHILSQPVKFEIMNDYTRTVNIAGRRVASLNGDTAAYSSLTARSKYYGPREFKIDAKPWHRFCTDPYYFNITEDWGIDDYDCEAPNAPEDYLPLVFSPLPADLPFINKDKLIHVAAYNGDIDRYARLRRPQMLKHEWAMVIHGIYHNAIFAKWWTTQIAEQPEDRREIKIRCAINARRIMSDDLSWLTADTPGKLLPDLIWYPAVAHCVTYEKLAHMRPAMFETCLRACIVANDPWTWDDLLRAAPDIFKFTRDSSEPENPKLWWLSKHARYGLWGEAAASSNKIFQKDILAAVPDAAQKFKTPHTNSDWWGDYYVARDLYFPNRSRLVRLYDPVQPGSTTEGPYDGMGCGIGDVDLALFLGGAISRETWKKEMEDEGSLQASIEEIWDLLELNQAPR